MAEMYNLLIKCPQPNKDVIYQGHSEMTGQSKCVATNGQMLMKGSSEQRPKSVSFMSKMGSHWSQWWTITLKSNIFSFPLILEVASKFEMLEVGQLAGFRVVSGVPLHSICLGRVSVLSWSFLSLWLMCPQLWLTELGSGGLLELAWQHRCLFCYTEPDDGTGNVAQRLNLPCDAGFPYVLCVPL